MDKLFKVYRNVHEQAFLPIFCHDIYDSKREVEAAVKAGCKVLEYTLRKEDSREMVPWIKKNFPDINLLIGSVIDDENIVKQMSKKFPQIMTISELADMGVDGFISMIGWTEESIRKYSKTHIVMPSAMTIREALIQTSCGAHFQKMLGSDLGFIKKTRSAPTFNFCPVMVTGGQTLEVLEETFAAGTTIVASGFDLTLKGKPADISVDEICAVLKKYIAGAKDAREKAFPELTGYEKLSDKEWLEILPHYHHFD